MPVMPIFHRLDKRTRVYTFLCVVGRPFYRWIQRRVEKALDAELPIEALVARLGSNPGRGDGAPGSPKGESGAPEVGPRADRGREGVRTGSTRP